MSPRVAKKDRGEPPKPMVKAGLLGFYPINTLALASLYTEQAEMVMGAKDQTESLHLKAHPTITLVEGGGDSKSSKKAKEPFDTNGKVFNGFSDAFYRGKLPQVLVVNPDSSLLSFFVEEFLDYVEKLVSLGFFISKEAQGLGVDPVDQYIPCLVITSPGIYFTSFLQKTRESLANIQDLPDTTIQKIMGKFARGVILPGEGDPYHQGKPVSIDSQGHRFIKVAGATTVTRSTIQYILKSHQFDTNIEQPMSHPVEILELSNALRRGLLGILPCLSNAGVLSLEDSKRFKSSLEKIVYQLGVHFKAFEPLPSGDVTLKALLENFPKSKSIKEASINSGDSFLLGSLAKYAELLRSTEELNSLDELKTIVHRQLTHV